MDIKQSPSGRIIRVPTGYTAFYPNPLPPTIVWDTELVNTLSRADHLLGKLSREGSRLANPHLLMYPYIAKEAVLSSKIEGIQATIGEILADQAGAHVQRSPEDLKEVQNYILALEYGLKLLEKLPLCLRLLKEIHAKLLTGVRGNYATPGEFRRSQNWIGLPGCMLSTAKYVPPPPEELMDVLSSFEKFLHDTSLPPLIHNALCHYQFEAIHPFLDGNGRVGRLLITLLLIERSMLPAPLLYLSAFFEVTRNEYYNQLYQVSAIGSWREWLLYFLNGVATQAEDVLSRAERINGQLEEWKETKDTSSLMQEIIKHFAINPYFTIQNLANSLEVAYTTTKRAVVKLQERGIITEMTTGKRGKVYCATAILAILEEPMMIP